MEITDALVTKVAYEGGGRYGGYVGRYWARDKKTDLLKVEDVKQEVEEEGKKSKAQSKRKPKPTTTKLKVEKPVIKEVK